MGSDPQKIADLVTLAEEIIEKYCRPPWLADKKIFWILDTLEWLKQ